MLIMTLKKTPLKKTPPQKKPQQRERLAESLLPAILAALFLLFPCAVLADIPFNEPLEWSEDQRAFIQDGPGWLLSDRALAEFFALDELGREAFILEYLSQDPIPETPENELVEGIERRLELVRREFLSFLDVRAQLLFLRGEPSERQLVDCGETFKPLEIWKYPRGGEMRELVVYQPKLEAPYRLWLPVDSKRVLYSEEMEYFVDQWEELGSRIFARRRIDQMACKFTNDVDDATGIDGLTGFRTLRPKNEEIAVFIQPPDDLAGWARAAAKTKTSPAEILGEGELNLYFPERLSQRIKTRAVVVLEAGYAAETYTEGELTEYRLTIEGQLERDGEVFEDFRTRFQVPVTEEGNAVPLVLTADRLLRPGETFLLRLKVVDEISGREVRFSKGFTVASEPMLTADIPRLKDEVVVLGEKLKENRIAGYNSVLLVPPPTDVVFGLWRAEVLVTGDRITEVVFLLDGEPVMTRRRPPFTAELRLETYPKEQYVRVEAYDDNKELVASDEVVLNQPRGELRVRILEPRRGKSIVSGTITAQAEVVVPEERVVRAVEFSINEQLLQRLEQAPWRTELEIPALTVDQLIYLTITAELDDGSRAEDVRFLNAPNYVDEVDVDLVELYTTVTDKSGQLVQSGLVASDFEVWEDGRPQEVVKFETVQDRPLTLGIVIDTSGSMYESLGEAKRAAVDFLENIIRPGDRCFALAFADRPELLMERTSDVGAVAERVENLIANGSTALHDAIVTSLYYYRGLRGRRALVLLSDGDDRSSTVEFEDALDYAKRSGVSIYAIGLRIGKSEVSVRRKLERLTTETGGRTIYIREAADLAGAYAQIEREFRSQFLVAYNSDQEGTGTEYRQIELKVKGGKLKGKTIRGYYP